MNIKHGAACIVAASIGIVAANVNLSQVRQHNLAPNGQRCISDPEIIYTASIDWYSARWQNRCDRPIKIHYSFRDPETRREFSNNITVRANDVASVNIVKSESVSWYEDISSE